MNSIADCCDEATLPAVEAAGVAAPVTLWVCVTCRQSLTPGLAPAIATDGRELFGLIDLLHGDHPAASHVRVHPVECMSGCQHACTVALSAPGKVWYLLGDIEPTHEHATAVLDCALQFSRKPGGTLSRIDRPALLRNAVLARIPPLPDRLEGTPAP